jgi:RNA polymerase sigma-70 factor (ECF subfamily)
MDEPTVDKTVDLVERAKSGDAEALDRLFARFLPALRRWASGRLPCRARTLMDTDDLVQETSIRALKNITSFELRHDGSLQAYFREAIHNRICDEVRRITRWPMTTLDDHHLDRGASPLDLAIGRQAVERYEAALRRLEPDEREVVVLRLEMEYSHREIADLLGKPSADAARMAVARALVRLAEEMSRGNA